MTQPVPTEFSRIASRLLVDVQRVCSTRDASHEVIERTKMDYPGAGLQFSTSTRCGLWADVKFRGDWTKFEAFLRDSIDTYTRPGSEPGDKSDLWTWEGPWDEDLEPEATRIFDRIDFALHYLTKEFGMELPFESILGVSSGERAHVLRVLAFVQALNDVLDPDGQAPAALQH